MNSSVFYSNALTGLSKNVLLEKDYAISLRLEYLNIETVTFYFSQLHQKHQSLNLKQTNHDGGGGIKTDETSKPRSNPLYIFATSYTTLKVHVLVRTGYVHKNVKECRENIVFDSFENYFHQDADTTERNTVGGGGKKSTKTVW